MEFYAKITKPIVSLGTHCNLLAPFCHFVFSAKTENDIRIIDVYTVMVKVTVMKSLVDLDLLHTFSLVQEVYILSFELVENIWCFIEDRTIRQIMNISFSD